MSIIASLLGKKEAAPNPIRETLFGDLPINAWPTGGEATDSMPWGAFVSARLDLQSGNRADAVVKWRNVLEQPGLEPRHYLQAWHFLRQYDEQPSPDFAKEVLGVVVEVALPQGVDLLAAYADHSARYYNYSGAGVVWEHLDTSLDATIDQLLDAAKKVVGQIGPWEKARPAPPLRGQARLSFLTPGGLHFGQGPMDALSRDPLGGRVLQLATILMQAMIAKTKPR